jgi:hypothetical protein
MPGILWVISTALGIGEPEVEIKSLKIVQECIPF